MGRVVSTQKVSKKNQVTASRFLLAAALLLASPHAHAQASASSAERASEYVGDAKKAFSEGRMHEALRAFRDAWALEQSPEIAANLAIIEAKFGKHRDAAEHFRFALSHISTAATDEQKRAIADGLDAEKREVVTLTLSVRPAGVVISIDGVAMPLTDEVYVTEGTHTLVASLSGYESTTVPINSFAGTTLPVAINLRRLDMATHGSVAAVPQMETTLGKSSRPPSLVPVFIGGGIAVVGAALGTVFLLKAGSAENAATAKSNALPPGNTACGTGTPFGADCQALHHANAEVDKDRNIAVAGFVVGGAAAAGVLTYWLWPRKLSTKLPETSAFAVPGHAQLAARWAW